MACVQLEVTVLRDARLLFPVLWGRTVLPREQKHQRIVSLVTLDTTVLVTPTPPLLVNAHQDITVQGVHQHQYNMSPKGDIIPKRGLLQLKLVLLALFKR